MQRSTKLLVAFIALPFLGSSQTRTRELNWQDFMKSVQTTIVAKPVANGEFTIFQITGINKFLYKVEIKGSVFELGTPVPTELQTLFRLRPEELQQTVENKKAEKAVNLLPQAIDEMKGAKAETVALLATKKKDIKNADSATSKNAKAQAAKVQEVINDYDELIAVCKEYNDLLGVVAKDVLSLKAARSQLIAIAQMDKSQTDIINKISDDRIVLSPSIRDHYLNLKAKYREVQAIYNGLQEYTDPETTIAEHVEKVKEALKKVEKADDLIEQEALIALYTDVDFLYSELKNPNSFKVVAPPVQMDGDMVEYEVEVTPTATAVLGPHISPVKFTFDVPTTGGMKIDFSVGPVLSFGSQAKDEKYYLQDVPAQDSVLLRRRDNNNTLSPSIAAMMHFYPRTGKYTGFGGMFGIGAGFQGGNTIEANLLIGFSYVTGKKQKLILSTGCSYLRVDRLKFNEFEVDKKYLSTKINLSTVTEKAYKPSWFFSVSYALSNKLEVK